MVNTNNIKCENLKSEVELLNKHIKDGNALWASIMKAKIENNYNVKIVVDKK